MLRAPYRQVAVSAALAFASWAFATGPSALAAPPTDQGGPSLAPAQYKPLPQGTRVKYDTWSYKVEKRNGFDVTILYRGRWGHYYAVFGKYGEGMYSGSDKWAASLDGESKSTLESLWPLEVGKKVKWNLEERGSGYSSFPILRPWTVTLEVVGTAVVELDGFRYPTYVVREHAFSEGAITNYASSYVGPIEYSETKWYNPQSGLILKSVRDWIQRAGARDEVEYSLTDVRFPQGTKTHVLAGTKVPGGVHPETEARLAAEIRLLRREAEERRKAEGQAPLAAQATPRARLLGEFDDIAFGRYHALVIGIGDYKHLPRLKTAVNDAKAVADILRIDYGFKVELLLDSTRDDIVDALDGYRETLGLKDNLLIYYAGHGWLDEDSDRGYWLAVDAQRNRRSNWVSNATVTDTLKTLQAKHVIVVADSCYSGTLTRGANVGLRGGDYWRRMAVKRARVALVSGGLEPVADIGGGGHSPFARVFIGALAKNDAIMDGTTLFQELRRPVMLSAQQTPEYSDVRSAGHDGGDFLFVRPGARAATATKPAGRPFAPVTAPAATAASRTGLPDRDGPLSSDQITRLLSGVEIQQGGYEIIFRANGTADASSNGGAGFGKWWVANDMHCVEWSTWNNYSWSLFPPKAGCFKIVKTGIRYEFVDPKSSYDKRQFAVLGRVND